jgi:hypothetical protein
MTHNKATPFRGEWDEDPKNFLGWFLQCMGAADDVRKAHDFVYYLQAGSDADEWFDDLLDEEKRSWVTIEVLFRRRWLNEEDIISTKDSAASKNEHLLTFSHPTTAISTQTDHLSALPTSYSTLGTQTSTLCTIKSSTMDDFVQTNPVSAQISCHRNIVKPLILSASTTTTGTQTQAETSQHLKNDSPTRVATSQSPALSGNEKKAIIGTTKATTSQILQNFDVFLLPTPSVIIYNSLALSTTTTALETRFKTTDFTQKHEKVKKSPILTKNSLEIPTPCVTRPENSTTRVHTSLLAPNDAVFLSPILNTTASSSESSQTPASIGHKKSALLCSIFESKPPKWSQVFTTIVIASKTRSASTSFAENYQKLEKPAIFVQKVPKTPGEHAIEPQPPPNDIVSRSPALTTTASSSRARVFIKKGIGTHIAPGIAQKCPKTLIIAHFHLVTNALIRSQPFSTHLTQNRPLPTVFIPTTCFSRFSAIFTDKDLFSNGTTHIWLLFESQHIPSTVLGAQMHF